MIPAAADFRLREEGAGAVGVEKEGARVLNEEEEGRGALVVVAADNVEGAGVRCEVAAELVQGSIHGRIRRQDELLPTHV